MLAYLERPQQVKWWVFCTSVKNVYTGSGWRSTWLSILSRGQREMPIQLHLGYSQQELML